MRRVLATLALVAVLVTGCTGEPGDQPPAGGVPSTETTGTTGPTGDEPPEGQPSEIEPSEIEPSEIETPRPVGKDQQFSLDEVAEFPDGLQIEIAGALADQGKPQHRGAEATNGEIVVASVRIENGTSEAFLASGVLISATYGDGRPAQIILDSTGELRDGFDGEVPEADELVAPVGFAVPISALGKVTLIVDCNDDIHDPVSFTGKVERG
jgi:hypothetical protein